LKATASYTKLPWKQQLDNQEIVEQRDEVIEAWTDRRTESKIEILNEQTTGKPADRQIKRLVDEQMKWQVNR
jgi:hypothetical protein